MRKAYSYIRMSTETQLKGDSLRRQLKQSEKYAAEHGLQLVDEIDGVRLEDIGISAFRGAHAKKGSLGIFLDALDNGKIEPDSVLLVESLDRLSRENLLAAFTRFSDMLDKGLEIVTVMDGQRYTKEAVNKNPGILFTAIGGMYRAFDESDHKSDRLKKRWAKKRIDAVAGTEKLTRTCPAWLTLNKAANRFDLIADRVDTVKKIFELCITTGGLGTIAKYLNQHEDPFGETKVWYQSYVKKILNNRAVLGEYQPHQMIDGRRVPSGEIIKDYFPQIIEEKTFLLAQAALSRRSIAARGRKGEAFTNLFSGLLYCGKCGSKLAVRNRGAKSKTKTLICVVRREGGDCDMPEWSISVLESRIIKHLREIDFSTLIGHDDSKTTSLVREIDSTKEKIKEKERGKEQATDLIFQAGLSEDSRNEVIKRMNTVTQELNDLKLTLASLQAQLHDEESKLAAFKSSELTTFLELLDKNKEDFFFRSNLNQILAKHIEKIVLVDEHTNKFIPWELEERSGMVRNFRQSGSRIADLPLDRLVGHREFLNYAKQHNSTIRIKYAGGGTREIIAEWDISFMKRKRA